MSYSSGIYQEVWAFQGFGIYPWFLALTELLYPSSLLPHKNHPLLFDRHLESFCLSWNIKILLTLDSVPSAHSFEHICCIGRLSHSRTLRVLTESSGLLYLSSFESLGLPLIEAATLELPVICPRLNYTKELLGDSPYYIESLTVSGVISTISLFQRDLPSPKQSRLRVPLVSIEEAWRVFADE